MSKNTHTEEIKKFSLGHNSITPTQNCMHTVEHIVDFVDQYMYNVAVIFQDADGLEIDGRTKNGYVLMANLFFDGSIDASVYDDYLRPVVTVKRIRRNSKTSVKDLINAMQL